MTNEKDILARLGRSERSAFEALYKMYAPRCVSFAFAIVGDENIARDITHDVFIKLWICRKAVSRCDSFSSYLYGMVRNLIFDRIEHKGVKEKYIMNQLKHAERMRNSTEERLQYEEMLSSIASIVSAMPPMRRKVFMSSRFEGRSISDISAEYGISTGTVENHITNALRDIRQGLEQIENG